MPAPNADDPLRTTDLEAARPPAGMPPAPPTGDLETLPPAPAVDGTATLPPASVQGSRGAPGQVPGYEILGKLGEGGMGVVYKARHLQLGRVVALKMILSGGHAREEDQARFRTEAEAIARLQHPNIVQVYEVGEHDGRPFFSLEFCAGGSLDRKLNGTPLPAQQAARLLETLARAMQAAHAKNVIHRDLKPANVLLSEDGTPKITDFGLAKKLDDVGQTASGAIMGTPSYMAPEQANGSKEIGPACDLYALGAILYELLTGRPPFKAATPLDTILQVVADEPVRPRQLNPATPRDLEAICLKCLEKVPRRRYPTAKALAEDLTRFLQGEPVAALQSGLIVQLFGALDRVQLQAQFATYGALLFWLAPLMFLPEVLITLILTRGWPEPLLGVAQFGRATGFVLVLGYYRGWRWRPQGALERQLWGVWGGYLLACFAVGVSGRVAYGFGNALVELQFYQPLAALTALAFFSLAGSFWGYCMVIGLAFLGLTLVMAANLLWAPLEFGSAWAAVLILLGVRLRRLGNAAPTEAVQASLERG